MNVTADPKTSARSAADPGRLGWLRARPMLAAALIYAVLSLLMVGPALVPGKTLSASDYLWNNPPWQATRPASVVGIGSNFELADQPLVFQPFLQYTRDVLPHVPLWNPHISGGRPYLANNQSAVFSLFNIPAYILPFWSALAVIAAIKLFVAALGAYALARRLGLRFGGALLTGLVFAFGTFFILLLGWNQPAIWGVLPWMLILVDMVVRRPGLLPGAGLAILVALSYFGGHAETTFNVMVVTLAFFVFRLVLRWRTEGLEAARAGPPGRRLRARPDRGHRHGGGRDPSACRAAAAVGRVRAARGRLRRLLAAQVSRSGCFSTTTGDGRPSSRTSSPSCSCAAGTPAPSR